MNAIIDITMKDLHAYFQNYYAKNPALSSEQVITGAIDARWPGANPDEVLYQAKVSWLAAREGKTL